MWCVHERFARQAWRTPERTALVYRDERLTYRELDARAARFAGLLSARGVGRGALVGVYLERSTAMVAVLLGTLKAGAGYVVLDPDFPARRLRAMAADAGVRVVVSRRGAEWDGDEVAVHVEDAEHAPRLDDVAVHPGGPACVMFTSGSTGRPKGIVASHHAVTGTLTGQDFARFGPDTVWLQCAPVSWDGLALELWGPLMGGGTCVLHPGQRPDPVVVGRLVAEHGVTSMYLSGSLFNVIVDDCPHALDGLRELLVGGEALSADHVAGALRRWPGLRLSNGYGPVEGMVFLTVHRVDARDVRDGGSVPIGRPLAGKRVYVLDEGLRQVADGAVGELYAAGTGLADGYAGRPGPTAVRFTADPYGGPGGRMYRTGDLARRRADGVLEFVGRADAQVKIRGFRVEPGEVEAVLGRHHRVRQVAVVARADGDGGRMLVAYVVPRDGYDERELRDHAKGVLADYLVPSAFVVLDALPLTPNGKLDRAALPEPPQRPGTTAGAGASDPRTPLEQRIADVWAEVLRVERVGVHDDFYLLGGNSLRAVRVAARLAAIGAGTVTAAQFLDAPTVARLAAVLEAGGAAAAAPIPRQARVPRGKPSGR